VTPLSLRRHISVTASDGRMVIKDPIMYYAWSALTR